MFIYLTASGIRCSTWDLHCVTQDLYAMACGVPSMRAVGMRAVGMRAVGMRARGTWAQLPRGIWDLDSLARD